MNFESFSFSESPRHTCMAEAKIQDAETAQKEKPRFNKAFNTFAPVNTPVG